jgi:hypothetical protein
MFRLKPTKGCVCRVLLLFEIIKEGSVSSKFILVYFDSDGKPFKVVNKQNKFSCAFNLLCLIGKSHSGITFNKVL